MKWLYDISQWSYFSRDKPSAIVMALGCAITNGKLILPLVGVSNSIS